MSWDIPTPNVVRAILSHCLTVSSSLPRTQPANAVMTGIVDMKILDLATPRCFIVLAHNENATPEQRMDRQIIGRQTSQLT